MSDDNIIDIIDFEEARDQEIVPVVNEGLKKCLMEDFHVVIFANKEFELPPGPELILIDKDDVIVGKHLGKDDDRSEYEDNEDYEFLSDDFVLILKKMKKGTPFLNGEYFIIPRAEFNYLTDLDEISSAFIAVPSVKSDLYLKQEFGHENEDVSTTIISFTLND